MVRNTLVSAWLIGLIASSAPAAVLDFSGDICGGPCDEDAFAEFFDDSYGDIPGQLDVTYAIGNIPNLLYWTNGYGGLLDVAYGDIGSAEIFLLPAPGFSVTLRSFQLGAFEADRKSQVTVSDGLGTVLLSTGEIPILFSTPSTFADIWTSSAGIEISFGPDAFFVGIDNITFDVFPTTPAIVPVPASLILMATAMAGLGGLRRLALRQGARG